MRILVDMDGILTDLLKKWLDAYNEDFQDCLTPEMVDSWNLSECVKPECSPADIFAYIKRPGFFDDLEPIPGGIEAVKELHARGHQVRFATAPASADCARAKTTWLNHHFAGSGLSSRDAFICQDKVWINADLLIDDKPETLEGWKKTNPGFTAAIEYPYNTHINVDCMASDHTDTERAWQQILNFVKQIEQTALFKKYG